jgi:hypothetical protein
MSKEYYAISERALPKDYFNNFDRNKPTIQSFPQYNAYQYLKDIYNNNKIDTDYSFSNTINNLYKPLGGSGFLNFARENMDIIDPERKKLLNKVISDRDSILNSQKAINTFIYNREMENEYRKKYGANNTYQNLYDTTDYNSKLYDLNNATWDVNDNYYYYYYRLSE